MNKDMEVVKEAFLANIGMVIKKYRIKSNKSQDNLASELNIDRSSVAKYENGTTDIKASTMAYISQILDFPLSEYMYDAKAERLPGDKPIPFDEVLKGLSSIIEEQKEKVRKRKAEKAQASSEKVIPKRPPKPDLIYSESEGWIMVPREEAPESRPVYCASISQDEMAEIRLELKNYDAFISLEKIDTVRNIYIDLLAADDSNEKERASIAKATLSYALSDFGLRQRKKMGLYLEYVSRIKLLQSDN